MSLGKLFTLILLIPIIFAAPRPAAGAADKSGRTIDFTQGLMDIDNKPILNGKEPITLGFIATQSLWATLESDKQITPEQKFNLDVLARKIYKNKAAILTVEDIAVLKKRIGEMPSFGPGIVGITWRLLDPNVGDDSK